MREIVVFGTGEIAELAAFYFMHDSDHVVAAFCVDADYLREDTFLKRPVVPFDRLAQAFPPERYGFFAAMGYTRLNSVRSEKVSAARAMGYRVVSYLSSRAMVFPEFSLCENCFILEGSIVQPFATVGANVTLWSGSHIGHHSVVEDDVFIAPHVVVSGGVTIGRGTFVGVNVTIRDHVRIGEQCVLGAGALVLEDQPNFSVIAPRGSERAKVPSTRLRRL
jgi:sugar O-acyltransferase (sialic acid O-acetyltransferase NeuD family)